MRRSKVLTALALTVTFTASSCSYLHDTSAVRFDTQEDVGSVHVAVQSVAPFEGYINSLQPQFALTTDQAIAAAIQQTQTEDSQLFRALMASLNISGPQLSGSQATTLNADGTSTKTGTSTTTPGDASKVAAVPAAPTNALGALALPDAHANLDQSLTFRTAAALLQEVALLDNYVRDAAISRRSRPYVVRLLVTLLPSARLEPYDAYSTISFFESLPARSRSVTPEAKKDTICHNEIVVGAEGHLQTRQVCEVLDSSLSTQYARSTTNATPRECDGREVEVLPLLVTDNLESSLHSDTSQRIRDMALALQAFAGSTSIGGNTRARSEDADKTLNRNLNSLFTLARLAPNTVEARLGAAYANSHYVMVPRTYNVTIIALVPTAGTDLSKPTGQILPCSDFTFVAQTRMRDAERGTLLPTRPVLTLTPQLRQTAANWGLRFDRHIESLLYGLVREAELGDLNAFNQQFTVLGNEQPQSWVASPSAAAALWTEMVSLSKLTGRSSGKFQVPLNELKFFSDQSQGTLLDDGKATTLQLIGGQNIAADRIDATLRVHSGGDDFYVNNTDVSVGPEGRTASIKFPSLYKLLKKASPSKVNVTVRYTHGTRDWQFSHDKDSPDIKIVWWPMHPLRDSEKDDKPNAEMGFRFREEPIPYISLVDEEQDKKDGPKPGFSMIVPSRIVRANRDGVGDLAVEFRSADKGKPQSVHFGVSQGAFIDHTLPDVPLIGAERIVTSDHAFVLTLKNLVVGSKLTLHAFRLEGDAEVAVPDIDIAVLGK